MLRRRHGRTRRRLDGVLALYEASRDAGAVGGDTDRAAENVVRVCTVHPHAVLREA